MYDIIQTISNGGEYMSENGNIKNQKIMICPKCGEFAGSNIPFNPNDKIVCPNCNYSMMTPTEITFSEMEDLITKKKPISWEKYKKEARQKYTINSSVFDQNLYNQIIKEEYEREHLNDDVITTPPESVTKNIPKCPTCGSTNIERISAGKKLAGSMLFGLFSKDAKSTFHCKNCNYKW